MEAAHGGDSGWIEYEIGVHVLSIGKAPGMNPSSDGPSCGLECENFEETISALRAAGFTFTMEVLETPVCHMAGVLDPAGKMLLSPKIRAKRLP